MANRSFYLDVESPKAYSMLQMDQHRQQRASMPGADRRTYPRPMTVYQRPLRTPDGQHERIASLSEKFHGCHSQRKGMDPKRVKDDDGGVPRERGFNPFSYLAGLYREVPESITKKPAAAQDQLESKRPAGWRLFLILLSGALPYVVVVLDDTIVATIIPVLVSEFQEPADIGWYATAYFLPMAVLMPVFGKCYSLWKIKWLFASCLTVLLIGSVVCGATSSSVMFIVGRAVAGAGAAGIVNGAMRIIGVSSARKERTLLEAAGALVMGGCTVAGPILGGVIADTIGWRWAFLLNIPVAFGALAIILLVFPDEAPATHLFSLPLSEKLVRLDPGGALCLIGGLCCLVTLLQSQSTSLGLSVLDVRLATATGVLLAAFLAHEAFVRADIALIPRSLLRQRAVWSCAVTLFFLFAGFINFVFFLPVYFQSVLGQSAQQSAIGLLPYVIASSVAAMLVGIGVSFVHYYNPFFSVGGVAFVTGAILAHTLDEQSTLLERALYEVVLGVGAGFLILANVAPCHIQLEEKEHSVANGFLFLSSLLGATMSLPISSNIFNRNLLREILALDVPTTVKLGTLADPTKVQSTIPAEFLAPVVAVLVSSIQRTYIVGLVCAVCCAVATAFVPFKRLLSDPETPEAHNTELLKAGNRLSGASLGRMMVSSGQRFSIV